MQALALLGEQAAPKIDAVVQALRADDPTVKSMEDFDGLVLGGSLNALASMGTNSMGAIPQLEKLEKKLEQLREKKVNSDEFKKLTADLKADQLKLVISSLQEEVMRKTVLDTIDYIKKSKPGMPGGAAAVNAAAPPPPEKKP